MLVNSSQNGVFNFHRLVAGCNFVVVIPVIFLIASAFSNAPDRDLLAKETNLIVREIAHELLLRSGDSTSRVLPVTETKPGTFVLSFENLLYFDHDTLRALSLRLLPRAQFPTGYTVTVHECMTSAIVYGFQISNTTRDIVACAGRTEPPGCYSIEITFPDYVDTYAQASGQKTSQSTQDTLLSGFTSLFTSIAMISVCILATLTIVFLYGRNFYKKQRVVNVNLNASTENNANYNALGNFLFDVKAQRLLLDNEVISLTDKECKILDILYQNFGELILRDPLMQDVWLNEGVITGRSLDMFVSKLRKKLSADPALKITNVHGKGYKLEV